MIHTHMYIFFFYFSQCSQCSLKHIFLSICMYALVNCEDCEHWNYFNCFSANAHTLPFSRNYPLWRDVLFLQFCNNPNERQQQ